MTKDQFLGLLQKYLKAEASIREQNLLHAYYDLFMTDPDVLGLLDSQDKKRLGAQIKGRIDRGIAVNTKLFPWKHLTLIAAAVAAIIFGAWFFKHHAARKTGGSTPELSMRTKIIPGRSAAIPGKNDIAPGGKGGTLKLTGGDSIFLSSAKAAVIIGKVLKYSDGSAVGLDVVLTPSGKGQNADNESVKGVESYPMSISTGKGQTYQMILADGTKVWLNAGSKLDFPSSFEGSNTRTVRLSGEGYFEVRTDKEHPFIVQSPSQELEVLGTRFNLSDYAGQNTVTSVLEGSVQIRSLLQKEELPATKRNGDKKALILKAGQQLVLNKDFQKFLTADEKVVIAWSVGDFYFEQENIVEVMNKIAYWYDVEIIYVDEKRQAASLLSGRFSRNNKLSEVLSAIDAATELQFRIEGRKVYVE